MDSKKHKLMIGCGDVSKKEKNTIYLDLIPFKNVDIVRDIEQGLPFDNNKFDEIQAIHIMEHMKDLIFVMNECHRVLKKDGTLIVEVPTGRNARIDPNHVRFLDEYSMDFFLYRDFNSITSGVRGWYSMEGMFYMGITEKEPKGRGLRFVMKKKGD